MSLHINMTSPDIKRSDLNRCVKQSKAYSPLIFRTLVLHCEHAFMSAVKSHREFDRCSFLLNRSIYDCSSRNHHRTYCLELDIQESHS